MATHGIGFPSTDNSDIWCGVMDEFSGVCVCEWHISKTVCLLLDVTNNPSASLLMPVERGHRVSETLEREENVLGPEWGMLFRLDFCQ